MTTQIPQLNRKPPRPPGCELCDRQVPHLTEHHLIPKSRHRDTKLIKLHGRPAMRVHVAWLCLPCHKHLHRHISERDLAYDYFRVDLLRVHPDISEFVEWISQKPNDFQPRPSRRARR